MKTKSMLIAAAVLAAAASQADTYSAVTNGSIFANTTWSSGFAPVAGDTNTWSTAGLSPNMGAGMATNSFHGQTLKVASASVFIAGVANPELTLRNLVLDAGGTMQMGNNGSWNVYLGTNNTFTLNGGTLKHSQGAVAGRNIIFHDGLLAGSGSVNIVAGTANATGRVQFEETIDMTGFTGAFTVSGSGRLSLPTITNATFNLYVLANGKLINNNDIAVKQLMLGGEYVEVGTYAYGDLTPAQQASLVNTNGIITVTVAPPEGGGVIYAVTNGNINAGTTWAGGVAPVAGDENTWRVDAYQVNANTTPLTFAGKTLEIATGGSMRAGIASASTTLRNLKLSGGELGMANNSGWAISLGGNTFQLDGGTLRHSIGSATNRNIVLSNAVLAGGGTINIVGGSPAYNGYVRIQSTVVSTNFTGTFAIGNNGRLDLTTIANTTNKASFAVSVAGSGKIMNNNPADIAVTGLTLGDTVFAKGKYQINTDLAAYSQYFVTPSGTQTVWVVNDPPVVDLYGDWADANGVTGGMTDDDDLDGMENLLEYALGGDPQVDDAAAFLPAAKLVGANVQYIYNRRIDAEDRNLAYGLILNNDLVFGSWTNIGTSAETGSAALNAEFEAVTNLVSTAEGKKFINLEVIQN